jgi:hypothetical protein
MTAKTPGPLNFNCAPGARGSSPREAANAARIAAIARSCASVSEPPAAVCTTISAREPSREVQTPSRI